MDVGAVLLLEDHAAELPRDLAIRLAGLVDGVRVLGPGLLPHVTLHQGRLPALALEAAAEELGRLVLHRSPVTLETTTVTLSALGNVFWLIEPTTALQDLHEAVNGGLRPLSGPLLLPHLERASRQGLLSEDALARLATHGFLGAGEAFSPHVTLCRAGSPDAGTRLRGASPPSRPLFFDHVVFCHLDAEGGVLSEITRCPLGGPRPGGGCP